MRVAKETHKFLIGGVCAESAKKMKFFFSPYLTEEYPVWWGTNPRIIQTVLDKYDISNSKIYTFCTSGGSGIESSISDLQTMYSNLNIVAGKRFDNPTEEDVKAWLESIG